MPNTRTRDEDRQLPVKSKMYFYNEYLFHELLVRLNSQLPTGSQIKTTQARYLREQLGAKLLPTRGFAGSKLDPFLNGFADIVQDLPNCKGWADNLRTVHGQDMAREITDKFRSYTGFVKNTGAAAPEKAYLPISPYMPLLTQREAVMNAGSRLVFVDGDAIANATADLLTDPAVPDGEVGSLSVLNMATVFNDPNMQVYMEDSRGKMRESGMMLTLDDLSGVSALRPFMSEREYADITRDYAGKPWANAGKSVMSPDAISRVRDVVAQLRQEGQDFQFRQDKNPGQVKIHFSNGVDVRVLDPEHEAYAGSRVYDDGVSMYYQTPAPKGSQARGYVEYSPESAAECLDIIHYALGQPVARRDKPGVHMGQPEAESGKNLNFHSSGNFRVRAGKTSTGLPTSIYHRVQRSSAYQIFREPAEAEAYLRSAVSSARDNLKADINAELLIGLADAYNKLVSAGMESAANGSIPAFSYNPDVKAIQEKYWEVLTHEQAKLFKPDKALEQFESGDDAIDPSALSELTYEGSPQDVVRQHLDDTLDFIIGNYDKDEAGRRFDPVNVSKFMVSSYGMFRNNDDLVSAMRVCEMRPEELKGSNFYNDIMNSRLIRFGDESSQPVPMRKYVARDATGTVRSDPFIEEMFGVIKSAIRANACEVDDDDILIDDNGIVHYTARRIEYETVARKGGAAKIVTGEIGQILAPNADGVVKARDHMFVPGYTAYIEPNKPGESKPYEERMVLRDYKSVLKDAVRDNIRRDLMMPTDQVGTPTSVNSVVRHLYETRYPLDFYERSEEGGMSPELRQAIIDTNRSRVKLDGKLMDESGRVALYLSKTLRGRDELDDYRMDSITLTDGRNPAIMEAPGDGMFDPYFTGNGPSQGVRYLVRGAKVDETGHVIPTGDLSARCSMVEYLRDSGREPDFDAVDRMNMTGNGLLHGLRETKPVGIAQVSFGLMTFEDGIVVTKSFSQENQVMGTDGKFRPLMKGDKLECHGNKGVISFVIDPEMSDEDARTENIYDAVAWVRANPELSIVMSPYSPVSRFNAGMAAEAMKSHPVDLKSPSGETFPGSIGYVKMTILQQTADSKSHFSDDGTQKRSYGAQVTWALAANDCTELLKDSFRDNYKAVANLREMLIAVGMDVDPVGRFQMGYHEQPGETRRVFSMQPLDYKDTPKTNGLTYKRLNKEGMKAQFGEKISMAGGFMEVPFELKFPDNIGTFKPIDESERDSDSLAACPGQTYLMPVMSSYLRSGQEFEDGDSVVHDYTNSYLKIYDLTLQWQDKAQKILDIRNLPETLADMAADMENMEPERKNVVREEYDKLQDTWLNREEKIRELEQGQVKLAKDAQSEYNKITDDLITRRFQGKHNIFRTGLMANKQSRSATAVWSPDPRCSIDEAKMNPAMMETLGLRDGDFVATHRDPVLSGSGIRYLVVHSQPDLAGIAVHPAGVPKDMDGDFDGDTVGVHVPHSKQAKAEAMDKLSVRANLLSRGNYDEKTGRYKLFIADGQDIAAGWAVKPELKDRYEELEIRVNEFEAAYAEKRMVKHDVIKARMQALSDINTYLADCASAGMGHHVISYANPEAHIKSIEQFVDDGAKGSLNKVQTYAKFLGVSYETDEAGHAIPGTVKDHGHSIASREQQVGMLKAKNMQQQYTGVGGTYSIRAMKTLTNVCPDAATRLNYLATQGVLQVKHDAHMADRFEQILAGPARDLWRGYKLKPVQVVTEETIPTLNVDAKGRRSTTMQVQTQVIDSWARETDDRGQPVAATVDEFKAQFSAVYASKDGLGLKVNPVLVDEIAQVCSEDSPTGVRKMLDLETTLAEKYAAPLQQLAYGGTLQTIKDLAAKQQADPAYPGLFDAQGPVSKNYNAYLADSSVMGPNLEIKRENEKRLERGEPLLDYKPIARQDVLVDGIYREPTQVTRLGNTARTVPPAPVRTVDDIKTPNPADDSGYDGCSPVD